jgi:hypothetical protein
MITLTVSNGSESVIYSFKTMKKFPYTPTIDTDYQRTKPSVISSLEDGTLIGRVKSVNGRAGDSIGLGFGNREVAELALARDFYDEHYPHKQFMFENLNRGTRIIVRFAQDSWQDRDTEAGLVNYSFKITEW